MNSVSLDMLGLRSMDVKSKINDKLFHGKNFEYRLKGVGQFNRFSVLWIKLHGNIQFLQNIKDSIEGFLSNKLKVERDKRTKFQTSSDNW